jgi:phage/plasmid-associated DNA primase
VVREAIEKYRADNDWMQHFLDECCELGEGLTAKSGELYAEYRAFCARSGDFPRNMTEFNGSLEQRGFTRKKTKKGAVVAGLEIIVNHP